jgi:hypothetical protein
MNLGLNLGLKFSAGSADLWCEQDLGWMTGGGAIAAERLLVFMAGPQIKVG